MRIYIPILLASLFAACSPGIDGGRPADAGDVHADSGDVARGPDVDRADSGFRDVDPGDDMSDPAVVEIGPGRVRGHLLDDVLVFRGLPFAAPPVGDARWEPPRAVEPWEDIRDAIRFGPVCPQLGSWGDEPPDCESCETGRCRHHCQAEDCLNLNVWTPAAPADAALPVMVWLHGGSFISGAGSLYDGRTLAERGGVVVVTANYRLGALSQLAHPDHDEPANYGFLDQVEVLRWVSSEIAAFGGDPSNVTVFGESAGGNSVCQLVTSPDADGLFDRAIMQSGNCSSILRPLRDSRLLCPALQTECPDLATIESGELWSCLSAECLSERLADALGCGDVGDTIGCMRELDAREIVTALPESIGFDGGGVLWTRFVDGEAIPAPPGLRLQSGDVNDVDFVMGTTADEATLFFFPEEPPVQTSDDFADALEPWGECSDELGAAYPEAATDAPNGYLRMLSDQWYVCPTNLAARWASEHIDVRLYQWTHVPWHGAADFGASYVLGAYHSSELPYVFGTLTSPRTSDLCRADADGFWHCCDELGRCFEPVDLALSDSLIDYWTDFARDGAPDAAGGSAWPSFSGDAPRHLQIEPGFPVGELPRADVCEVWEGVWSHVFAGSGYCAP